MKGIFTLSIALLLLFPFYSLAQTVTPYVINVTGSSAMSGYYRFDWSVGEMCLIDTYSQPNVLLENGFLHPGTERPGNDGLNFFAKGDVMIFPNPVYTITEVNIQVSQPGNVHMNIMDAQGRLVMTKEFAYNGVGRIEKINMDQYRTGTYFLYMRLSPTDASQPARTGVYKITKLSPY